MSVKEQPPPTPKASAVPVTGATEARDQLLKARAKDLAMPAREADSSAAHPLLAFALAGERLAVDLRCAREVFRLEHLTPIPGAPPHVLGVTHLRGAVLLLIDLPRLLGRPSGGVTDLTQVIVLGQPGREVGLLVESMEGIVNVDPQEIGPAPAPHPLIRGVTRERLVWLDAEAIARHEHPR